ncbi:putative metalloprotease CJM1_0395 family protein [Campylobacter avium]|uniref:putative metalloprotease CJM1_0395 family protein n=1 Tax=Campylobacter avium TaxID=522485 RepID=UPI002353DFD2|nr:putative metalloprotease CJM1_0395 family protein [Campylobacter avium]
MQITANSYYNNSYSFDKKTEQKQENTENSKNENSQETKNENELSPAERTLVRRLQVIDTKVRVHEMAHVAAGGGLTGAATYSYTKGPDNKMYATAGEVSISTTEGNTPQETIAKARQIQAAAMAPSDPSPQDYKVAASAMQMELKARAELVRIKAEENKEKNEAIKQKDETLRKDDKEMSSEEKASIARVYVSSENSSSFSLAV